MRRKSFAIVISAVVVMTFLSAETIFAEERIGGSVNNMYYVAIKGGIYNPTNDLDDYDTGFNGEIAINRYLSQYFALEAATGYFRTSGSEKGIYLGYPYSGDVDINVIPVTATGKGIIPFDFGEVYAGVGAGIYFVGGHFDDDSSNLSLSDNDSVWGMQFLGGVSFDITDIIFVGVEGKYIMTQGVEMEDNINGIKVEAPKFNVNGYTVSALLGLRF